jgi:quercetin dioxygenase-like cupin family protein
MPAFPRWCSVWEVHPWAGATPMPLTTQRFRETIQEVTTGLHTPGEDMQKTSWTQLEPERMNDLITRQMVNGENATVSRLLLSRGAVVPRHFHVSEQYSLILSGTLKFIFNDREVIVNAGEVLYIPANEPHSAVALEDTVDLDFFSPRREDWIRKEDAYLRQAQT